MFNVTIDPSPHCYWNDIMNSHCPPGYHGCEGGVCMCSVSFVCSAMWQYMCVHVCVSRQNLPYQKEINQKVGTPCLKLSAHMPHPQFFLLFSQPPSPSLRFLIRILLVMLHGTFDPLLPLSFPYLPSCWFICALSLSSHLSTLYISSFSSPESARIDTAVCWLSARSTHLLVCVSRLL